MFERSQTMTVKLLTGAAIVSVGLSLCSKQALRRRGGLTSSQIPKQAIRAGAPLVRARSARTLRPVTSTRLSSHLIWAPPGLEPVSHPGLGEDVPRAGRVWLEFFAKLGDVQA